MGFEHAPILDRAIHGTIIRQPPRSGYNDYYDLIETTTDRYGFDLISGFNMDPNDRFYMHRTYFTIFLERYIQITRSGQEIRRWSKSYDIRHLNWTGGNLYPIQNSSIPMWIARDHN